MPRNTKTDMSLEIGGVKVGHVDNTYSCRESHASAFHDSVWEGVLRLKGFKNNVNRTVSDNMSSYFAGISRDAVNMVAEFGMHPYVTPELMATITREITDTFGVKIETESAPMPSTSITTRYGHYMIISGGFEVMPAWWWAVAASRMLCCRVNNGIAAYSEFKDPKTPLNMDQLLDKKNTLANEMAFDSAEIQAAARDVWINVVQAGKDAPGYEYVARGYGPEGMASWSGVY
jgi:hypothetical protein